MSVRFQFKTVKSWLTLWLLLLSLLPISVASIVIYNQQVDVIRAHRIDTLEAIRDLKVRQVENWIQERLGDGEIVARSHEIKNFIQSLGDEQLTEYKQESANATRILLDRYLEGFDNYAELFLLDRVSGNVLVSTTRSDEGNLKADYPYFAETLEKRETVISDIYFSKTLLQPSMVVSTPIFDREQKTRIIAILVARIDLENTIYELLQDRTGLGETGETLIVNKEGYALNELRWYDNAPLNLNISATPARLAIQGHKGIVEVEDYRNVHVLAAYTFIPQTGWGFVSKQDHAEVFSSIQSMLYKILILVGISSGIIVLAAFYIAKKITSPIQEMKDVSAQLQSGDFSARNSTDRADELGFLAQSFNNLADSIEKQILVQKGSSEIIESLVSAENVLDFAQVLLKNLLITTDSQLTAFYLRNDDGIFNQLTSIGTNSDSQKVFNATNLEGELGVVLASKKIEHITAIPEGTRFIINAVAGQVIPREIITVPLMIRSEVKAIVSLASLKGYSQESLEILNTCWQPMNTALISVTASDKTYLLARQLAEKNEELTSGNEELQSNSEELQAQSEELKEQAQELRKTAAELEVQRVQVEVADRLKSEFLSNMSHELRTPLNSVLALSQLMISRGTGKNPAEEKKFLEVIERNGRQLLILINDILDLAKIESGRMDIYPSVFNLSQTVQHALDTIRPLAEEKGLTISLNPDKIPNIESDEEKINQIILNLLSNAVKFTNQGEITLHLKASPLTQSFEVCDTGIGIMPEDLSHIFDEFRQVDGSTTRKHEGTGLGLSICQKLAQLLGGQIVVDSTYGQGSTFTLELPLQMAIKNALPATRDGANASLDAKVVPGLSLQRTILVVDDDHKVRELVSKYLTAEGYQVIVAESGRQGLQLAKELQPYAITLDILMPDMDGWEVLKQLKDDPVTTEIPVIMLSVSEDTETGLALGATGYLTKPVDKNQLCIELEKISQHNKVKRILIVDDDSVARNYIEEALTRNGYLVAQADGGKEALRLVREYPPDVLLLDLLMPDIDGYMVLDELRKFPVLSGLAVIIMTAKDLTNAERSSLEASAKKVIAKDSLKNTKFLSDILATLQQIEGSSVGAAEPDILHILVVEDNQTAALQVQSVLEESGYRVSLANNGEEGLASIMASVPDGVVLDLMMPGVDGFEVLETIRSTPWTKQLPVLILTAKELTVQDRARLKRNHVKQLIQKGSVNRAQLIAAVGSLFEPTEVKSEPVVALPESTPIQSANKTVLVIEDNPDNLLTISTSLADEDCVIVAAVDGAQGVEMAEKVRPGLILMDMQLPVMSGKDATQKIRGNTTLADIPIIALTASAMKGDREKMLAMGCDDYLSKPFNPTDLQEMVRKWLK